MVPPTLSWREVLLRTWREVLDDNCLGLAAQLSFYFLLALFPAVLFVVALLVIKWFIGIVSRYGFAPFAWYRIVVGTIAIFLFSQA